MRHWCDAHTANRFAIFYLFSLSNISIVYRFDKSCTAAQLTRISACVANYNSILRTNWKIKNIWNSTTCNSECVSSSVWITLSCLFVYSVVRPYARGSSLSNSVSRKICNIIILIAGINWYSGCVLLVHMSKPFGWRFEFLPKRNEVVLQNVHNLLVACSLSLCICSSISFSTRYALPLSINGKCWVDVKSIDCCADTNIFSSFFLVQITHLSDRNGNQITDYVRVQSVSVCVCVFEEGKFRLSHLVFDESPVFASYLVLVNI